MLRSLGTYWTRLQFKVSVVVLDRIFKGRQLLWVHRSVPQRAGKCLGVKATYDRSGAPTGIFATYMPKGGSVGDLRQIPVNKLKFFKNPKMWGFDDS